MDVLGIIVIAALIGLVFGRGLQIGPLKFLAIICVVMPSLALYRHSIQHELVTTFLETYVAAIGLCVGYIGGLSLLEKKEAALER